MEMVRLANIVPGIFRKALQDVEIKGAHMHMAGISCAPIRRRKKCYLFSKLHRVNSSLRAVFLCGAGTGYTIPAGWGVMVCPPAVHLNPDIYEDPLAFNPWRWQVRHLISNDCCILHLASLSL
jgi:cytochrome P450